MALEDERRAVAETMRRALGQENALTAVQARLFVRCLQHSWQVPPNPVTQGSYGFQRVELRGGQSVKVTLP